MSLATQFVRSKWFYKGRFLQMQKAVEYLAFGKFPFRLENSKKIAPYYLVGEKENILILYNFGLDKETFTVVFRDGVRKEFTIEPLTMERFQL